MNNNKSGIIYFSSLSISLSVPLGYVRQTQRPSTTKVTLKSAIYLKGPLKSLENILLRHSFC